MGTVGLLLTEKAIKKIIKAERGTFRDTGKSIVVQTKSYGCNWFYSEFNKQQILESILRNLQVRTRP